MSQLAFVRLKPYDPSRGHIKKSFRMGAACGWGDLLFEEGVLMEINAEAARWLEANVKQNDHQPGSGPAFDVWYSREAVAAALQNEYLATKQRVRKPSIKPQGPPPLQSAEYSDLDKPSVTTDVEADLLVERELANRGIAKQQAIYDKADAGVKAEMSYVSEANHDVRPNAFDDIAPSDEDLKAMPIKDMAAAAKPRRRGGRRKSG